MSILFIVSLMNECVAKLQMRHSDANYSDVLVGKQGSMMFTVWIESSSSGRCRVIGPPWPRIAVANVDR